MFLREFILGNNQTGLVTNTSGSVSVVGGENATLAASIMPGQLGIYVGSASTASTYTFPSATIAAWNSFFATITAIPTTTGTAQGAVNAASHHMPAVAFWSSLVVGGIVVAGQFAW